MKINAKNGIWEGRGRGGGVVVMVVVVVEVVVYGCDWLTNPPTYGDMVNRWHNSK